MSVYQHKYEDDCEFGHGGHNEQHCQMCGGDLHYPFLGWDTADGGVFLCRECCFKNSRGFVADMRHCAKIEKSMRLYPEWTIAKSGKARRSGKEMAGRRTKNVERRDQIEETTMSEADKTNDYHNDPRALLLKAARIGAS